MTEQLNWYPAFINVANQLCVVIGGGMVATRKVEKLLQYSCQICVVSPTLTPRLKTLWNEQKFKWKARLYRPDDIVGAALVFAATNHHDVNLEIRGCAAQHGVFTNIVTMGNAGDFLVPATVVSGAIQVAMSTSGNQPRLAKELRELLEEDIQKGTNGFVEKLRAIYENGN